MGLPEYRLPREKLDREIDVFRDMGVEFRTNQRMGRDFSAEDLKRDGYEAVYIAVGSSEERRLNIPGEDAECVTHGIAFLRSSRLDKDKAASEVSGRRVLVIGGGNVAVDCARVALRLGASRVDLCCLEERDQMPAFDYEIKEAQEEGIVLHCGWGLEEISTSGGVANGVVLNRCLSLFDKNGRFAPVCDPDNKGTLEADYVVAAIGQSLDRSFADMDKDIIDVAGNTVKASFQCETKVPWVFAGGDCATAPQTVIAAVRGGKNAASSIDRFLGGDGQVLAKKTTVRSVNNPIDETKRERYEMPLVSADCRKSCFDEVALGMTEAGMVYEAERCLRCDVLKISRL